MEKTSDWVEKTCVAILIITALLVIFIMTPYLNSSDIKTGLKWKEIKSEDRFRIFYNNDLKVTCFTFQDTSALSCVPSEFLRKSEIKK